MSASAHLFGERLTFGPQRLRLLARLRRRRLAVGQASEQRARVGGPRVESGGQDLGHAAFVSVRGRHMREIEGYRLRR